VETEAEWRGQRGFGVKVREEIAVEKKQKIKNAESGKFISASEVARAFSPVRRQHA